MKNSVTYPIRGKGRYLPKNASSKHPGLISKKSICLILLLLIPYASRIFAQGYVFEEPDSAQVITALKNTNPGYAHPRLYARAADFDTLRIRVGTGARSDTAMHNWYNTILASANGYLTQAIVPYSSAGSNTRNFPTVIYDLSMAYQITGDTTYSNRVIAEMNSICTWPNWGVDSGYLWVDSVENYLDVADIEQAFSVGFDWCYAAMTPAQRTYFKKEVISYGLKPLLYYYTLNGGLLYLGSGQGGNICSATNRNPWCNGAAAACAMAFGDEDSTGTSANVISKTLICVQHWLAIMIPDGASPEGPGYADGSVSNYIKWMAAMQTALDTSYNYFNAPGMNGAVYYPVYLNGPVALMDFHDAGTEAKAYLDATFYYANTLPNGGLGNMHKNDLSSRNALPDVFDLIWYKSAVYGDTVLSIPFDKWFVGDSGGQVSSGSFRSSFTDPNAMFLGFHAGENNVSHTHLDIGHFNIDYLGLNWAQDFGTESLTYNGAYEDIQPDRFALYRLNPGGHNTLLINPSTSFDGQSNPALNVVTNFVTQTSGAFAIVDMSKAYQTQANSIKRGYALTANRSKIILQDEINLIAPSTVYWNMHTPATVQISADGKTATLTQQGKKLRAILISPAEGTFIELPSSPLPQCTQNSYQTPNPGVQNLAVLVQGQTNFTIMVEIDSNFSSPTLPLIPLSKWTEPRLTAGSNKLTPSISYAGPQIYTTNTAITTLTPVNNGSAIPNIAYATVSTVAGVGGQAQGIAPNAAGNIIYEALNNVDVIGSLTTPSTVATLAGSSGNTGSTNGTGSAARFNSPFGVAVSPVNGNIYVADANNNLIRQVTPAGVVTTFAGTGTAGSTNGYVTSATFSAPHALVFDSIGNLYVSQSGSGAIRKISTSDTVSTITTGFNNPWGLAYYNGNLYVSEVSNNKVSMVSLTGTVTPLAGSGVAGYADGQGAAAMFNGPRGVAVDSAGNVYVADYSNSRIRMITPSGLVTTVAGNGTYSVTNGVGTAASFEFTAGLALDTLGNLYIGDPGSGNLRKMVVTGYIISPALPAGLSFNAATGAISGTPTTVTTATNYTVTAFNKNGSGNTTINIRTAPVLPPAISYPAYETYSVNAAITSVTPVNTGGRVPDTSYANVTTVTSIGGQAQGLAFNSTSSIMYAALSNTDIINELTLPSTVSTLAGTSGVSGYKDSTGSYAQFNSPFGIAVNPKNGNMYVADVNNNRIRMITPAGVVTTFAGTGTAGTTDGYVTSATFNAPHSLVFDTAGNLYVSQSGSGAIRMISTSDTVFTINTSFNNPWGLAYYSGNLYVSEVSGNKISMISVPGTGTVAATVLAGSGSAGYADGTGTAASFNSPRGITVDNSGNVYVADYSNYRIRMITPAGVVTTIAGNGTNGEVNAVGTSAEFESPAGLTFDNFGNLYVGDAGASNIRRVAITGYSVTPPLPAGLTLNPATGVISGTPTAPTGATDYTVTAYNETGQSSSVITIRTATLLAPNISYAGPQTYSVSVGIASLSPVNTGGTVPVSTYGRVSTVYNIGGQVQAFAYNSTANILYASATSLNIIDSVILPSTVKLLAGTSGSSGSTNGTGSAAKFNGQMGIAINPLNGNIYAADVSNNEIRQITPQGVVTTFAGSKGSDSSNSFDLPVPNTQFNLPRGLTIDNAGNMYISESGSNEIRKISSDGVTASTVAQGLSNAWNIAYYGKNIYAAEVTGNDIKISSLGGILTTIAGSGTPGSADGKGSAAGFNGPRGIAVDSSGNVYVADYSNNKIRRIDTAGNVVTIAGSGSAGGTDSVGKSATFNCPAGLTLDGLGNLYIGDAGNSKIRKVIITGYTINPALPAGLKFDSTRGIISGTATATSAATNYTITASNSQGISETVLNITVVAAGHRDDPGVINTYTTIDSSSFSYYPNPVSNILTVKSGMLAAQGITLELVELESGRIMKTISGNGSSEVDVNVADLNNGYYILVVKKAGQEIAAKKICKQ